LAKIQRFFRQGSGWTGGGNVFIDRLERTWRVAATGFSFAVFFCGGALAAATLFPILGLLTAKHAERHMITRRAIHRLFRAYLSLLQGLKVLSVDFDGTQALRRIEGRVIVANHPTLLDVVILMALMPRVQCIVKHELWSSRYLGGVMRHAGYIRNDLEPDELLMACRKAMQDGSNLIIFPEGTRSRPDEPMRFQRGAANIALATGANIQTVFIKCFPLFLTKSDHWWRVPASTPRFSVTVGDVIDIGQVADGLSRALAARAVMSRVEAYYAGMLSHG
jgi:1-acyl-sn-glycerol-3-phosphate acyltransferase